MSHPAVHVKPDPLSLVKALVPWLAVHAGKAVKKRGVCSLAVSGGSTPILLFRHLAEHPGLLPWSHIDLYLVDERDVYARDPLSNYGMLTRTLLASLPVPPRRVHPWLTLVPAGESLAAYRRALSVMTRRHGLPRLDITLQGMGSDGHTASVFPGSPQLESDDWVAYGPGPNAARLTLTLPLLANADHTAFLATGTEKAARVKECLDGRSSLPAAILSRDAKDVHWFLDEDSAREL